MVLGLRACKRKSNEGHVGLQGDFKEGEVWQGQEPCRKPLRRQSVCVCVWGGGNADIRMLKTPGTWTISYVKLQKEKSCQF